MIKGTYYYYINPHVTDTDSQIIHLQLSSNCENRSFLSRDKREFFNSISITIVIFSLCHFGAKCLYTFIDRYWRDNKYHSGGMKDEKNRDITG